ncbi:MAG: hypothetical protein P1U41_00350 [Vicingaceae bacterium]|nr:hypothetical protein [Vicingaceae bacterium]
MEFKTITISELPNFVTSTLYKSSKNCPITVHRAISQSKNPRADKDDPALTLAIIDNNIVGYIGYLPDTVNNVKVYWNSCWWVDDNYKAIAIPLLLQFVKTGNEQIVLTDLTPNTKQIISNLPFFSFSDMESGFRGYLKFNLHEVLPQKKQQLKSFSPLLKVTDSVANTFVFKKKQNIKLQTEEIVSFTDADKDFISSKNTQELMQRNSSEIEWIYNNPWVGNNNIDYSNYHFTSKCDNFKTSIIRFTDNNNVVAIIYLKQHNHHLTIPFIYFEDAYLDELSKYIYNYALDSKSVTITVFNTSLKKCFENDFSFITNRKLNRNFAFHESIQHLIKKPVILQDGDGDVAFC